MGRDTFGTPSLASEGQPTLVTRYETRSGHPVPFRHFTDKHMSPRNLTISELYRRHHLFERSVRHHCGGGSPTFKQSSSPCLLITISMATIRWSTKTFRQHAPRTALTGKATGGVLQDASPTGAERRLQPANARVVPPPAPRTSLGKVETGVLQDAPPTGAERRLEPANARVVNAPPGPLSQRLYRSASTPSRLGTTARHALGALARKGGPGGGVP